MKAKLLKIIRKNWFIGIADTGEYVSVQKRGIEAYEWSKLNDFFEDILRLQGYDSVEAYQIVKKHREKRCLQLYYKTEAIKRKNLLNKITR